MSTQMMINDNQIEFHDCKSCRKLRIDPKCKRECIEGGHCCYEPIKTEQEVIDCQWK